MFCDGFASFDVLLAREAVVCGDYRRAGLCDEASANRSLKDTSPLKYGGWQNSPCVRIYHSNKRCFSGPRF